MREKLIIAILNKFYKWIVVPLSFEFSILVGLALSVSALVASFKYPADRIILILVALFSLGFPVIAYLMYYSKKIKPEKVQLLIALIAAFMFFIAAILNFIFGVVWMGVLSLLITVLIIWLSFTKKRAWAAEPSKLVFFKGAISSSYYKNLLVNEIIMFIIVLIGLILRYGFQLTTISTIFLSIGIGGMFLAPIWCLFIPSPDFLSKKSQSELKGKLSKKEKFIGAVFGASFPGRPKIAVESTDNSLFVTNKHLFCITIGGLRFGPVVEETNPFFKMQAFNYLKEKGERLLKLTPKKVLYSHDYNFSIPFENVKSIRMASNLILKIAGLNIVSVSTKEGRYTFVVHYPDQFEKLKILLRKVIPNKIVETFF